MYFGNVSQNNLPPLSTSVLGLAPSSPDLKYHLPLQLLPAFSKADHSHKALVSPGFGHASSPLKRKHSCCGVCRLKFNSEIQASSHYSGTKHAKRLRGLDPQIRNSELAPRDTSQMAQVLSPPGSQTSCSDTSDVPATSSAREVEPSSCVPAETIGPLTDPSASPRLRKESEKPREREEEEAEKESEEDKAMRLLYCSLCKVAVNSASQLQAHNRGTKHKTMLEARRGGGAIKSFPRSGVKAKYAASSEASTGLQNKTFHCEICDVHVNSETQLKQHISSRRHKDRAAGKPVKPKFSPYTPTQHQQGLQAVRLVLRKEQEFIKPLTSSCLIQQHLSAATAAVAATLVPFHLRPTSGSSPALFQSQQLSRALLHPATAPICSTHTPVLFSPF